VIFKLLTSAEWAAAQTAGQFDGSAVDHQDGYIHFSTADQVVETARRYFADVPDVVLLAVDPAPLGDALRWEPSRGGDLFPHLYAPLPADAVTSVAILPPSVPVDEAVAAALHRV
jgi:uncharacterized protein (DUF952 family)